MSEQASFMAKRPSDDTNLGERIDQAREHANLNLTQLGVEVGVGRSAVSQWISGRTQPSSDNLRKIAVTASVNFDWLATGRGPMTVGAPAAQPRRAGFVSPPEILGGRDLPVYAAVEGGPGHMAVSTDPIELVPRPWYMREVRDGYAVLVVGESMSPAFEPGQMAIVNPRLPPMRGTDVILVSGEDDGEFTASIKRLVSWTAAEWKVQQFNPKREFAMSRKEWPKALRVVGKYYG